MRKQFTVIGCMALIGMMTFVACGPSTSPTAEEPAKISESQEVKDYPPLDLNPTGVLGLGPEGQAPTALADLSFTEEELKQN